MLLVVISGLGFVTKILKFLLVTSSFPGLLAFLISGPNVKVRRPGNEVVLVLHAHFDNQASRAFYDNEVPNKIAKTYFPSISN